MADSEHEEAAVSGPEASADGLGEVHARQAEHSMCQTQGCSGHGPLYRRRHHFAGDDDGHYEIRCLRCVQACPGGGWEPVGDGRAA